MTLKEYYLNRLCLPISETTKSIDNLVPAIEKLKKKKTSSMNAKALAAHAVEIEAKENQLNHLLSLL